MNFSTATHQCIATALVSFATRQTGAHHDVYLWPDSLKELTELGFVNRYPGQQDAIFRFARDEFLAVLNSASPSFARVFDAVEAAWRSHASGDATATLSRARNAVTTVNYNAIAQAVFVKLAKSARVTDETIGLLSASRSYHRAFTVFQEQYRNAASSDAATRKLAELASLAATEFGKLKVAPQDRMVRASADASLASIATAAARCGITPETMAAATAVLETGSAMQRLLRGE